jgi:hypothetical protein
MIEVEHAAEALAPKNAPCRGHHVLRWLDQEVVETSMISFSAIMRDVFADELPKMSVAKRYDLGQALLANRAHEAFGVGVQIWAPRRQSHGVDAAAGVKITQ